ncbi:hypothetical protein RHO13_04825 [Orbus wheelerorum]|uniref:zinc ABC transporter substrate-binding protein n=1 Tax=Orbus wheelerorum TaxID=3074111 RepID=UPI00370D38F5
MRKNEIYIEMLRLALPYIRNIQGQDQSTKANDTSCYFEAELVHNLTLTILDPTFDEHDIWFLNYQAKSYYKNCNAHISINYCKQIFYIKELFKLVPDEMKAKLIWSGPSE